MNNSTNYLYLIKHGYKDKNNNKLSNFLSKIDFNKKVNKRASEIPRVNSINVVKNRSSLPIKIDSINKEKDEVMKRKLFKSSVKNYNSNKIVNSNKIFIMLLIFLVLISLISWRIINIFKVESLPFCSELNEQNCQLCPDNAICFKGKFECINNHIKDRNSCIINDEIYILTSNMEEYLLTNLKQKNGNSICNSHKMNNTYQEEMNIIKHIIHEKYKTKKFYEKSWDLLIKNLLDNKIMDLYYFENIIKVNTSIIPFQCKIRIYFNKNKKIFLIITIIFFLFIWFSFDYYLKRTKLNRAEFYYKNILNLFEIHKNIKYNEIYKLLKLNIKDYKEYNKLLKYINKIRILDEQISYYKKHGEIYWTLV